MFTSNTLQANGLTQHYYRSGGAKLPLVLLHGFTDDGSCWFPVAEVLAQDYDVILPDARGHGQSSRIADIGFDNEALAEDVAALISALKLNRPAVLGHSMGSFTALILAAKHPELVGCLLLEDPPLAPPPTPEMEAARGTGMQQWADNLRRMQGQSLEELAAGEGQRSPRWSAAELQYWAAALQRVDLDVFAARSPRPVWQALMQQVACPVLLLYGDNHTLVDDSIAQEAAALWKDGQAVQIADAGHSIRRDNAPDYLEAVSAFLSEHYAG
ncbi:MAG: alpha/beta hydrolase [Chloroflexi bacterium]|uniref:alpha/beta fold hydrolase n=1 Tax=Candidatus Flexifilum breve TaxID=3140694 RepID=UPI00313518F1|nr:alpha/beta hydrolase [Chloroflexota bacterium]